ncbi:MAG: hypothetical protein IJI41_03170 [Anaerolineaceae bacterium]|nr:hypothetical protein [Anaerolineaceae bacterium]
MKKCPNCEFNNIDEWNYCVICGGELYTEKTHLRLSKIILYSFFGIITVALLLCTLYLLPLNLPGNLFISEKWIIQNNRDSKDLSYLKVGDSFFWGSYEQDNILTNGPEPIKWQVLANKNDMVLVVSKEGLDSKPFNETIEDITWEKSSIRSWLNSEFYDGAFSSSEKKLIQTVIINNADNPDFGTEEEGETEDRVFLLSIDDANLYFPSDKKRKCTATSYARRKSDLDSNDNIFWWLRSPGGNSTGASFVDPKGNIRYNIANNVDIDTSIYYIRPAFWLNISYEDNELPSKYDINNSPNTVDSWNNLTMPTLIITPTNYISTPLPTISAYSSYDNPQIVTNYYYRENTGNNRLSPGDRACICELRDNNGNIIPRNVNLRSTPEVKQDNNGNNTNVIDLVYYPSEFLIVGGPVQSTYYTWYQININGKIGWISEGGDSYNPNYLICPIK